MKNHTMDASRMRHRVVLQQAVMTVDELGGQVRSWSNIATLWAQIVPKSGGELFQNQRRVPQYRAEVTLRYRSDITTDFQLLVEGEPWEITDVTHDPHHMAATILQIARYKN
jgi:SPP1 family predicted phage head-tail adaptor